MLCRSFVSRTRFKRSEADWFWRNEADRNFPTALIFKTFKLFQNRYLVPRKHNKYSLKSLYQQKVFLIWQVFQKQRSTKLLSYPKIIETIRFTKTRIEKGKRIQKSAYTISNIYLFMSSSALISEIFFPIDKVTVFHVQVILRSLKISQEIYILL